MDNVQAWLEAFGECHRQFESMCARYETMKAAIEAPRSISLDGMPRSGGNPVDTIGNAVARLDALREQIAAISEQEQELYEERDRAISQIIGKKGWLMQAVLRHRYLDLLDWDEITCIVLEVDKEADENFDSRRRYIQVYHKRGREALEANLQK